jgi:hypothetical protein
MTHYDHFAEAAGAYAGLVAEVTPDQWNLPGLGVWDLRALVGHGARALITVDTYLDRPAQLEALDSPVAYLTATSGATDPEAVAERGRQAGVALGDDPAAAVRHLVETVADELVAAVEDPVITTVVGGMRLSDYLGTRTFELVVHGLDIAAATDSSWAPPADALAASAVLAAQAAVLRGEGATMLRLVTGREPGGMSVV